MKYRITVYKFAGVYVANHDHFDPTDPIRPSYRLPGNSDVQFIEEDDWNIENSKAIDAAVRDRAIAEGKRRHILAIGSLY